MSLTKDSLKSVPISFATCSIGYQDEHTLPKKLNALHEAGFTAIELAFPDLVTFASLHLRHEVEETDYEDICAAARVVKAMCDAKEMKVLMLQPFANFEGWPEGSEGRKDAFSRAEGWIKVMEAAGTDMLQVGSTDTPAHKLKLERSHIVSDLRQLADMLAKHKFRMCYENWCWSTHAPDWKDVWSIVEEVDRPNVGLCLDTFQTAGGEWADPRTKSGLVEKEGVSREEIERQFHASLAELSKTVPADKIYLLQISDAYKLKEPFTDTDDEGLRPRGRWSHDYRPRPFAGGYLPVADVAKAILNTGFRSWFSYEIFDSGPDGKGKEYELDEFAAAAAESHVRLMEACLED